MPKRSTPRPAVPAPGPARHGGRRLTFLEFVCGKLLGPPAYLGPAEGESYWPCPFHEDRHPSFHTKPDVPEYKHGFRCWSCPAGGDVFNLMRRLGGPGKWPQPRAKVRDWPREWEGGGPPRGGGAAAAGSTSSSSGLL